MRFRFDEDANALYFALHDGEVTRTIALTDTVSVDIDADRAVRGIEFVCADAFVFSGGWPFGVRST